MSTTASVVLWGREIGAVTWRDETELAVFQYTPEFIEYAYSLMAGDAGISMEACRLYEEEERAHFMTKRFDRTDKGGKWHMQSLGAMRHYDFNHAVA